MPDLDSNDQTRLIRIAEVRGDGERVPDALVSPVAKLKLERVIANASEVLAALPKGVAAARAAALRGARALQ